MIIWPLTLTLKPVLHVVIQHTELNYASLKFSPSRRNEAHMYIIAWKLWSIGGKCVCFSSSVSVEVNCIVHIVNLRCCALFRLILVTMKFNEFEGHSVFQSYWAYCMLETWEKSSRFQLSNMQVYSLTNNIVWCKNWHNFGIWGWHSGRIETDLGRGLETEQKVFSGH